MVRRGGELARIVLAIALAAGAVALARIHVGANLQRVHVRYVPGVSVAERTSLERRLGLAAGLEQQERTWSYLLEQRSHDRIKALVSSPLVEDTHNIDRAAFRIVLERPDLPGGLRWLAAEGWLPWLAGACAASAAVLFWLSRREVLDGGRHLLTWSGHACRWLAVQLTARDSALPFVIVGVATALLLPLAVEGRPDESSFVHLYEAPSILAGDHPYRDFFEWGAPLPAYLSAGAQWLVGHRLIGELVLQWSFTLAGVLVVFHLGRRQAHVPATLWVVLPLLVLLSARIGYSFSKLFCFPVGIWLAWRYIDRPTAGRSAALGVFTAVAFLFRHDYGVWVGFSTVLAFLLARVSTPDLRSVRSFASHCSIYALAAAMALLPWAIVVATSEGLVSYVGARAERFAYSRAAGTTNPYGALLSMNPARQLRPVTVPPPRPGVVSFEWAPQVTEEYRTELEHRFHLERTAAWTPARAVYEVPNVYDFGLIPLQDFVLKDTGVDWQRLALAKRGVPPTEGLDLWLAQLTMLLPIALIVSGVVEAGRAWFRRTGVSASPLQRILAGIVLAGINETLLREWSYFMVVGPLIATLSARFLARGPAPAYPKLALLGVAVAAALVASATYAAWAFRPPLLADSMSETVRQVRAKMAEWMDPDSIGDSGMYLYLRECSTPNDRLIATGSTPYYVPYYTQRAMAGGHLDWSIRLRDDPVREAQSLEILKRQSVPFVIGRGNPLDSFEQYPRIRAYLMEHYEPVAGTNGMLLADKRRQVVRTYGPDRFPCFR